MIRQRVFASAALLADDGVERPSPGAAPTAFRIWKSGENATSKGTHLFTRKSATRLLADQETRGTLYSIDVDHMSLSDEAPPEHHRAVGWHRLEVREAPDGPELWAVDVEWTDAVRAALESTPPGFRYFSPAYDVARESGEIVGYLNTALTNNPATYQVTALATVRGVDTQRYALASRAGSTKGSVRMKYEDCLAALMGDDEEKKEAAKAAMKAAFGEGDGEKKEASDDEEKKEASDDGAADEKKEAKKAGEGEPDGDEKKEATAVAASKVDAKSVREIVRAEMQAERDDIERDRLLASRRDLSEKLVASLKKQPLSVVRDVLDGIPVTGKKNLAADTGISATRGATQGSGEASRLPPDEKAKLDERMGIRPIRATVQRKGVHQIFPAMTPDEARQFITAQNGGK